MVKPEELFENLLGREAITPDSRLMSSCIKGKNVLVSGAGGSIGTELCRQLIGQLPAAIILFERSEFAIYNVENEIREQISALHFNKRIKIVPVLGSVCDRSLVELVIQKHRIDTIFHSAAYKQVPLLEKNPVVAVQNNIFGTAVLAKTAENLKVKNFILVSTDKAVRPVNIMGATKRIAEQILQSLNARGSDTCFTTVRFGNVIGTSGSVLPRFHKQVLAGGPVTVTHQEVTRYFMTSREAAQLVIQAGSLAKGGDVFVLDMGKPVRIADMARSLIRLMGLSVCESGLTDNCSCGPCQSGKGIAIHYTGLREGEKLKEDLLTSSTITGTSHSRILRVVEDFPDRPTLDTLLERLEFACAALDQDMIRKTLNDAVGGPGLPTEHPEEKEFYSDVMIDAILDEEHPAHISRLRH